MHPFLKKIEKNELVPGLTLTTGVAVGATALQKVPYLNLLSPLIVAVILGILLRNTLGLPKVCQPGITFSLKRILRLAVILLGLQLSLFEVSMVGPRGLGIVVLILGITFFFTIWLGDWLGVNRKLSQLIASGTSICGASAVVATSGVVEGSDEDTAYAVGVVTLFGTASMLLYPAIAKAIQLSSAAFGLWCGSSIHEVAQVVAASFQAGDMNMSGQIATITKLSRVTLLVPILIGLGLQMRGSQNQESTQKLSWQKLPIPWFVLGFVVLVLLNSLNLFDPTWKIWVIEGNRFLLTLSLAGMGLQTNFQQLKLTGVKPLYLGAASWLFISIVSLVSIYFIYDQPFHVKPN